MTAGGGERLIAASPAMFRGEQAMTVVLSNPTASIYSEVDRILLIQQIQTVIVLTVLVPIVVAVNMFILRWNNLLERKVKERTNDLEDSKRHLDEYSKQLEAANEQLKVHDRMQQSSSTLPHTSCARRCSLSWG